MKSEALNFSHFSETKIPKKPAINELQIGVFVAYPEKQVNEAIGEVVAS